MGTDQEGRVWHDHADRDVCTPACSAHPDYVTETKWIDGGTVHHRPGCVGTECDARCHFAPVAEEDQTVGCDLCKPVTVNPPNCICRTWFTHEHHTPPHLPACPHSGFAPAEIDESPERRLVPLDKKQIKPVHATANTCRTCGHEREQHIYHEGACRPGFVCQSGCEEFVSAVQAHRPALRAYTSHIAAPTAKGQQDRVRELLGWLMAGQVALMAGVTVILIDLYHHWGAIW